MDADSDLDTLKSIEKVSFPCKIVEFKCIITFDVVDSDIPLLLSNSSRGKRAKIILNLENDKALIF